MSSTALLIGATGLIGKHLLPQLLESTHFTQVGEFGRRVTSFSESNPTKLQQRVIDFEKLSEAGLKDGSWDVIYITLGTTKAIAGSKAAFTKIDKDYVVNAAREARVPDKKQRLVYLSSVGANARSPVFYSRSKGETEAELAAIGYDDFIVLRAGMFDNPDRSGTSRDGENLPAIQQLMGRLIAPSIKVPEIVKTILAAGELGSKGLPKEAGASSYAKDSSHPYIVIENEGMKALFTSLEMGVASSTF